MRLALISDLHAHLPALDAVLADAEAQGADRIVCLGDVIDMGPEPNAVCERLRERGIPTLTGNHDPLDEHPTFPLLAAIEAWTADVLDPDHRAWLDGLPFERHLVLDGVRVWCVHGSPVSNTDQILPDTPPAQLDAWCGDTPHDLLAAGHTHVPCVRRVSGRWVVNAGSVSQPFARAFDGTTPPVVLPWAEYALVDLDGGRGADGVRNARIRRVTYDLSAYEAACRRGGFPDPDAWLAQWLRAAP